MIESKEIVEKIVEGIQELKGKKIVIVDMTMLSDRACDYFVIAEGTSSTHVNAITDSVRRYVREQIQVKPYAVDGQDNALWVAFDYGQILVHIFDPETRAFYDIEHLWEDAVLTEIPDKD